LKDFKLINILSTEAISWVDQPLSWGFSLEWNQNGFCLSSWVIHCRPDGWSDFRWMNFLTGQIQESLHQEGNFLGGLESQIVFHFTKKFRGLLKYNYYFNLPLQIIS